MNNTLIGNVGNKNIYLVQDEKIPFYIGIPNEQSATIVINLVDNIDTINPTKTALTEIPNKITEIYNKFNYEGVAVVTPVIDGKIMNGVKENIDPQYTSFLNKAIGYLINKAYSELKQNGKEIFKQIKLNNNETYLGFNERFASMYPDRIELVKYDNAPTNNFVNQTNIPMPTIGPEENTVANTTNIALDDAYKDVEEEPAGDASPTKKEPGFVSYVLLGVIVAVLSLIGLYLLL